MAQIDTLNAVHTLLARTGFRLTRAQNTILIGWIRDGETDVALLADAIVCC